MNANWVNFKMLTLLEVWLTPNPRQVECYVYLVKTHWSLFHLFFECGVPQQHYIRAWFKDARLAVTHWHDVLDVFRISCDCSKSRL